MLLDGTSDSQQALELCRQAGESARGGYVYKLLLVKEMTPADAVRWLEAGVDDFLGTPLEHGELLARLLHPDAGWTVVAASHDPVFLAACDHIYVLAEGQVVRDGTFECLLADASFAGLMRAQHERLVPAV